MWVDFLEVDLMALPGLTAFPGLKSMAISLLPDLSFAFPITLHSMLELTLILS